MLRLLLVILVILVVAPALGLWFIAQRALPTLDGVLTMSQLYRLVTVKFDERAIPYIEASSEGDAYFVQGYVTAAQRMFQMDMLRRSATGQMSEVFGTGALARDKLVRTIGINRLAQADLKKLSRQSANSLKSYTQGVNAYLAAHDSKLPLPFYLLAYKPKSWTESDSLAILKYLEYQSDESWPLDDLRQRLLEKFGNAGFAPQLFGAPMVATQEKNVHVSHLPANASGITHSAMESVRQDSTSSLASHVLWSVSKAVLPEVRSVSDNALPLWGSNAWSVGSGLSDTKGALLACDKHGPFLSPDQWYYCTLTAKNLHVSGATVPGVPGVMLGRSQNVAWAATDLKVDGQDLVLEDFSPQFTDKYKTPSGWQAVTELQEDIPVRFANPLVHKILITKDGPLLSRLEDKGVALSWAAAEPKVTTYETLWHINRAENLQGFLAALQNYSGSPKTFVYADSQGTCGYHIAGNVSLHGGQDVKLVPGLGSAGTGVVQGATQGANWPLFVGFNQLPGSQSKDFYAIADAPFTLSVSSPYRYQRAAAMLNNAVRSGQKLALPDLALMQVDQNASLAHLVKTELDASVKNASVIDGPKLHALEMLRAWDENVKADSVAASIYEAFLHATARRLLQPKLGEVMMLEYLEKWPRWTSFVEQVLINKPKAWLPPEERTYETFMVTTFSEALKNLKLASGSEDMNTWTWQTCHRAKFQDNLFANAPVYKSILEPLIGVRSIGVGGDADCLNACNVQDAAIPFSYSCTSGPTTRLLIDMSDHDKFFANLVLGQSENPISPFRSNQLPQWLRAEPHAMAFSSDQAERQTQHKLLLTDQ
ncbi:MAG TPA: penicillin acylase family protein [Oculatellaceae cyanobacterium]